MHTSLFAPLYPHLVERMVFSPFHITQSAFLSSIWLYTRQGTLPWLVHPLSTSSGHLSVDRHSVYTSLHSFAVVATCRGHHFSSLGCMRTHDLSWGAWPHLPQPSIDVPCFSLGYASYSSPLIYLCSSSPLSQHWIFFIDRFYVRYLSFTLLFLASVLLCRIIATPFLSISLAQPASWHLQK